ncbi:MAG TPA: polyphenol oxidase family protein, partial [Geminicoccaceae bacterium]
MSLDIITSPDLDPLRHGFFGRAGGASSGVFQGLNCGQGSTDQAEAVTINRARVAQAMGVAPEALLGVHQVHSADVIVADHLCDGPKPRADAMVTNVPGLALSILTADCQPVLFADAEAGVIGAAHAGWKGAFGGVIEATLAAMERLGGRRQEVIAAVGPTIGRRSYEVDQGFFDRFIAADEDNDLFFTDGRPGHHQ